ncbi:hypothetical protein EB796_017087 [Bugula neritina]|uniref:Uncharacterized protein n=1 Tax=Bugula neritina TaxID=10212 RepID=A0A7J7JFP0_BUGNE|nr:hypothetical protein EB796_017087 [Bugula neritina]
MNREKWQKKLNLNINFNLLLFLDKILTFSVVCCALLVLMPQQLKSASLGSMEKSEKIETNDKLLKIKTIETNEKIDKIGSIEKSEKLVKGDEGIGSVEKSEKVEKSDESIDKMEIIEEIEDIHQSIESEKSEKMEKGDKGIGSVEKSEKVEKSDESIDKMEIIEEIEDIHQSIESEKSEKMEKSNESIDKIEIMEEIEDVYQSIESEKSDKRNTTYESSVIPFCSTPSHHEQLGLANAVLTQMKQVFEKRNLCVTDIKTYKPVPYDEPLNCFFVNSNMGTMARRFNMYRCNLQLHFPEMGSLDGYLRNITNMIESESAKDCHLRPFSYPVPPSYIYDSYIARLYEEIQCLHKICGHDTPSTYQLYECI